MAVSLAKGQKVDLTKNNPGLKTVRIGLGWDTNKYDGQGDFDLDAEVFLLAANEKVKSDADFIFYNQPTSPDGAVQHLGDNRIGEGDGDDESVTVELGKVDSAIEKIRFTVTIDSADERNQNFGQVSNAFIRILNADNEEELIRYDLGEDFSIETAIVVGELYRHNGEWKFTAIGSGYQGGLAALGRDFGVNIG